MITGIVAMCTRNNRLAASYGTEKSPVAYTRWRKHQSGEVVVYHDRSGSSLARLSKFESTSASTTLVRSIASNVHGVQAINFDLIVIDCVARRKVVLQESC